MLELSDIQSSKEELEDYYAKLQAQHVTPAWIGGGISVEPRSEAVPYLWHWRDLRAAGDAGGRAGRYPAGRTPGSAPDQPQTARGSQQYARRQHSDRDAGEIARAHRHSAAALRLIIEG